MKVAVVGGGSTYTPELVDGIARLQHLVHVDELVLTDPAESGSRLSPESRSGSSPSTGSPRMSSPPPILAMPCQMPRSFSSS